MMSSSATKKAAAESAAVQREGLAQQKLLADRARNDLMPFADAGRSALTATTNLAGLNGPEAAQNALMSFVESPGYLNALAGGTRAIERTAASRGGLLSGNTLRQVQEFGQGLADQSFSQYYNRIAEIARGGQAAAAGQQLASNTLSGQIGDASKGIAQTIASAGGQQASIYGNLASNLGNAGQNALANWRYQDQVGGGSQQNALYSYAQPELGGNAEQPRMTGGW